MCLHVYMWIVCVYMCVCGLCGVVWCDVYVCVCVVFVCLYVYQHVLSSLLASLVKGSLYVTVPQPKSHHTALKSREWLLETF